MAFRNIAGWWRAMGFFHCIKCAMAQKRLKNTGVGKPAAKVMATAQNV